MSDRVLELFERYVAELAAGEHPDPAAVIERAGEEGEALAGMIAAYLAAHPQAVAAGDVISLTARPELEPPRPWSQLLPELRARRHTTRAALVHGLAERLDVAGSEDRVTDYLHELEVGLLSPRGVRPAVVAALAAILDVPRSLLETSRLLPADPPAAAPSFARPSVESAQMLSMLSSHAAPDPRVDDLFTGGADG